MPIGPSVPSSLPPLSSLPPKLPCKRGLALAAVLSLGACATVPTDPTARAEFDGANDPAEPTNRQVFAANQFVDRNALQPVARGYQDYVPGGVRRGIHNFTSNLAQPGVAVNDLLQGNASRAWNTTQRFAINTTVGGAGLFDVATGWNRPSHQADFGQTLGVWGVEPGPAVTVPLLGPSNVRDAVGTVGGFLTNPVNLLTGGAGAAVNLATGGLGAVDGRAGLLGTTDSLEKGSLDYYATLRSVSAQRRAALVQEGREGRVQALPASDAEAPGPASGVAPVRPAL